MRSIVLSAVRDWSGMRLIDADAIVFTHAIARSIDDGHNWNELCVTKDEIDDMPSAEPERTKGKWSNYKDEHCCSVCKCVVISNCWDDDIRYDYCPYCGADMRGK